MSLESIAKERNTISPITIWLLCLLITPIISWLIHTITEMEVIQYQDSTWSRMEEIEPRTFRLIKSGKHEYGILDDDNRFWSWKNGKWVKSPPLVKSNALLPPMPYLNINHNLYVLHFNGKLFSLEDETWIEEEIPAEIPSINDMTEHQSKMWLLGVDDSIWNRDTLTNPWKFHSYLNSKRDKSNSEIRNTSKTVGKNLDEQNDSNSEGSLYFKLRSHDSDLYAIGQKILRLENDSWVTIINQHEMINPELLGKKDNKLWLHDSSISDKTISIISSSFGLDESPFLLSIDLENNQVQFYYKKDFKNIFGSQSIADATLWGIYNNKFLFSIENHLVELNSLEDIDHLELKKIPDEFLHVNEVVILQNETIIASTIVDKGVLSEIAKYLKEIIGLIILIQFASFWIAIYLESKRKKTLRRNLKQHSNDDNIYQFNNNDAITFQTKEVTSSNVLKTSFSKKLHSSSLTLIKTILLLISIILADKLIGAVGEFLNLNKNIQSLMMIITILSIITLYSLLPYILTFLPLRNFNYELAFKRASFLSNFNLNGAEEISCYIQMFKGDFDTSDKLFSTSIANLNTSHQNSFGETVISLCSAYARSKIWEGKFAEANKILDRISKVAHSSREYLITYAELLLITGEIQEARKIFDLALKKNNISQFFIRTQRIRESGFQALLLAWEGNLDKAKKKMNETLKLDKQKYGPESSHLLIRAGEIYRLANDHQNSDKHFRTALQIDPEGHSGKIAKLLMEKRNFYIKDISSVDLASSNKF